MIQHSTHAGVTFVGDGLANLPFSRITVCGELVFMSGQVALGRGEGPTANRICGATAREQTACVLANMAEDLALIGLGPADVIKATLYVLDDVTPLEGVNEVCAAFFPRPGPAWAAVAVCRLPHPEALVEVELVARRGC